MIFLIYDDFNSMWRNTFLFNIILNELSSFIWWCIINIDNMIIRVVLHKDRIKIPEVESTSNIIIRRHNNTKRQLMLFVHTYFIFLFILLLLYIKYFLNSFLLSDKLILGLVLVCFLHLNNSILIDVMYNLQQMRR